MRQAPYEGIDMTGLLKQDVHDVVTEVDAWAENVLSGFERELSPKARSSPRLALHALAQAIDRRIKAGLM